jgi:hypothetical protein
MIMDYPKDWFKALEYKLALDWPQIRENLDMFYKLIGWKK